MPKFNDVTAVVNDGNAFAVIGAVTKALKKAGYRDAAEEFTATAFNASSYNELLALAVSTVNVSI
jgi:hypothetical protein